MFDESKPHARGCDLAPAEQAYALAAYVHRYTGTHRPAWATKLRPNGKPYMPQFRDDSDWLAHSLFPITKAGKISRHVNADCYSRPTWPNGTGD